MIFAPGIKGMGYAPDDDDDFDQQAYDDHIDDMIDRQRDK